MTTRVPLVLLIQHNNTRSQTIMEIMTANSGIGDVLRYRTATEARTYLMGGDYPRRLPNLIFLDTELPDIPGLTLLRSLKSNPLTRQIPIVVLGGTRSDSEASQAYAGGANVFVPVQTAYGDFVIVMTELVMLWTNTAKLPLSSSVCDDRFQQSGKKNFWPERRLSDRHKFDPPKVFTMKQFENRSLTTDAD